MTDSYNLRPIGVTLVAREHHIRGFRATQWQIDSLVPGDEGDATLWLQLTMTERAAYRFNLTSATPRLFVRCGDAGGSPTPSAISASQDVAASWMDGEQQVLDVAMPVVIQAWLEAYLARHGEAPEEGRKKKRKGAGRAREMTP